MRKFVAMAVALVAAFGIGSAGAQEKKIRMSIGTGGTAGVYYPLGGGLAAVLSKYVPGVEATAEVTAGSIANLQLIGGGKSEVGFTMADAAWDAYNGLDKFKDKKVALRTLVVFYPNRMHVVTVEGKGIEKMTDLKGKRAATGAPASGTEVMAMRLLEAYGLDPNKDVNRERLSLAESVNALKDGKVDALMWVGGVPTPGITDLAATPGKKIKLIDHGDGAEAMRKKYGPLYVKNRILANAYPGETRETTNVDVWNLLVVPESADENVIYQITKTMFEKKDELVKAHKDAAFLSLDNQLTGGSPIPFHPGALRYFKERGLKVN
ncbi:MAG: TAXI family TRAP transporter solute-binding subunit [Betaproteobacteria bacterium]|nr:TAXI family TRAP transporter solute-binding subunit [Betaproteobacteria bacterium]PWB61880.1 MAG: C4-dicarboxylate ABC transporter substrate-binding protein [Betaproteobacteria bacterium]